jgi:TolB-like protein
VSLFAELKRRNVFRVGLFYVVTAWLVIEVAETVLPLFEVPDGVLRGLVVLLVIGLVPALGLSWIYELTPEGIQRDAGPLAADAQSSDTGRKLNWATLAVAVVAIGFMATDRIRPAPPVVAPTATPPAQSPSAATGVADTVDSADGPDAANAVDTASIAVLPFADLSPTGDQAYFSDGIAEEILNALARVEGLAVASRTSAFQFKGREIGIPEIAKALGVRHILEGSVRKAGDSLRITTQLNRRLQRPPPLVGDLRPFADGRERLPDPGRNRGGDHRGARGGDEAGRRETGLVCGRHRRYRRLRAVPRSAHAVSPAQGPRPGRPAAGEGAGAGSVLCARLGVACAHSHPGDRLR